jgi:DNA-directed RNA polymerase specialized sigma54-like protein
VAREIAEALGIHESTVTRIVARKGLCCARGVVVLTDLLGS